MPASRLAGKVRNQYSPTEFVPTKIVYLSRTIDHSVETIGFYWLTQRQEELMPETGIPSPELVAAFLDFLKHDRRRSPGTVETYRHYLKRYTDWLSKAGADYREPTLEDAHAFCSVLTRNPTKHGGEIAPSTVNTILSTVTMFYRWLNRGTSSYNPFTEPDLRFDARTHSKTGKVRYLRDGQREAVVEWMRSRPPEHVRRIFRLMLAAGLRVSEAATIRGSDFAKRQGVVWVEVHGKGDKHRSVPVLDPDVAEEILSEARRRKNETLSQVTRRTLIWWAQICRKETGVNFTSHRLRHMYGTDMIELVDIDILQDFMGHESLDTTRIYAKTVDKRKRDAAQRIVANKRTGRNEPG
jgi:site-specific recombinase XerD